MNKKTFILYVLRDLIIAMLFGLVMISTAEVSLTGYYKLLGYIAFIVIALSVDLYVKGKSILDSKFIGSTTSN